MNWDAIGAIGQAMSALALVFVLVQLRHAWQEMQRAAVLTRLEGTRDIFLLQATDEGLLSLLDRVQTPTGVPLSPMRKDLTVHQYFTEDLGLGSLDARRLLYYCMAIWHHFEASIESIDRLSPGVRWEVNTAIKRNFSNAPLARWFEIAKRTSLNPSAVRYIDNLLAQPG